MKMKIVTIAVLAVVALLMVASVAQAASGTTTAIIKDAQDGHLDGNYTAAQVQAALDVREERPVAQQYTNVEGVLERLPVQPGRARQPRTAASCSPAARPSSSSACGLALMGGGLLLRRRLAA